MRLSRGCRKIDSLTRPAAALSSLRTCPRKSATVRLLSVNSSQKEARRADSSASNRAIDLIPLALRCSALQFPADLKTGDAQASGSSNLRPSASNAIFYLRVKRAPPGRT